MPAVTIRTRSAVLRTRVSAGDTVNRLKVAVEDLLDFGPFPNFGPPPPENFKALLIFLHLPSAFHSRFLKAEVKPSDARKQTTEFHISTPR